MIKKMNPIHQMLLQILFKVKRGVEINQNLELNPYARFLRVIFCNLMNCVNHKEVGKMRFGKMGH
jgi:hypothetical protein